MTKPSKATLILTAIALIYGLLLVVLPKSSFWITDGGNKFIQVQNLATHGRLTLDYPAAELDPEARFFPFAGHHFHRLSDGIHSFYPFYFPLLSLPGFKLFGIAGIYLLPMLAGLLVVALARRLDRDLAVSDTSGWGSLLLAFGTPLLFYSLTFWEHTLALFFSTAALVLLVRELRRDKSAFAYACAGVLLGLSTILREEGYILLLAVLPAGVWVGRSRGWRNLLRQWSPVALGWLAVMGPVWILQTHLYGHFLGIHWAIYGELSQGTGGLGGLIRAKAANFFVFLFRFHAQIWLSVLCAAPMVALVALGAFCVRTRDQIRLKLVLLGACGLGSLVLTILLVRQPQPVFQTLQTQALLSGTPFLLLLAPAIGQMLRSEKTGLRFGVLVSVLTIAGTCLALNTADMGIIWGPRHFLCLYPLLVPLVLPSVQELNRAAPGNQWRRFLWVAASLLLLTSLAIQGHGLRTLFLKKNFSRRLVETVGKSQPRVILTDVFWLPEELAAVFPERQIMQLRQSEDLGLALERLRLAGVREFSLILSPRFRCLSPAAIESFMQQVSLVPGPVISNPRLEFMTVQIFHCRTRP
jgi:4-amino-4-deoxy-L-arabinose transferase-like glycosyltransferase